MSALAGHVRGLLPGRGHLQTFTISPEHARRRFVKNLLNLSKQGLGQKPNRSGTGLRSRQLQEKAGGVTPIGLFSFLRMRRRTMVAKGGSASLPAHARPAVRRRGPRPLRLPRLH
jgi:hypothetical protein